MRKTSFLGVLLLSVCFTSSAHAATKEKSATLDCARNSLSAEIEKLDKSVVNVLEFTGECVEDVVVEGHQNLTIRGLGGASITATVFDPADELASTVALKVSRSEITVESVTINGGSLSVECTDRSVCVLRDVDMLRGWQGLAAQSQSAVDVYGASSITGTGAGGFAGIGVYGASAINVKPHWANGFDPSEPSYAVSGFVTGVVVQDGSFFRSDNLEVTGNLSRGIFIRRGSTAKVFGDYTLPGVWGNDWRGIEVTQNSTAQIVTPISGNIGEGFVLGELSSAQVSLYHSVPIPDTNPQEWDHILILDDEILCSDDTARSSVCP